MLLEMLNKNAQHTSLPRTQREIVDRLAATFESDEINLLKTPAELTATTQLGNKQQWQDFLNNDTVKAYIKGQMASMATVSQRKAFESLSRNAANGDVQAAKQINELSGILNQDSNKVIVLHQIKRGELPQ